MKKLFAIIAVLIVAVVGAFAVTACGDDSPKKHVHTSASYEITKHATCTEEGERTGVCTVCGETFTETIPMVDHYWHLLSAQAATCTQAGEEFYECVSCSKSDKRTLPALGHDDSVVIAAVPVSCVTDGWTEGKRCSRCEEIIVAPEKIPAVGHALYYEKYSYDTHVVLCENCNYSEIADCEFEEIEVAPTCTTAGKLIHTCRVCGDNHEHETAAAIGHIWTDSWSFYRIVDGVYKHRKTCHNCEAYEEEACSNSAGAVVMPDCETIGYTTYTCEDCENTFNSDFVDALGHDWTDYELDDDNADPYAHTHKRRCQRLDCSAEERGVKVGVVGTVLSARTDESCESDAYTEYTCSLASCSYAHTQTHNGTALGHSFGAWEYSGDNDEYHTHTHRCLRTNCSESETKDCRMTTSSQVATCTKPDVEVSVCEDCLHVDRDEGSPLGHKFSGWISIRETNGTLWHTHVCTICNLREYGAHTYETTTRPADCEHNEATVNTCSVCGYSAITEQQGTALGHEWEVVSCDANGHSLICNRYEIPHEITAPHDHGVSNLCAFCNYDGLTYGLSVSGDYFIVKNDNGVPRASEIIVAASRPNPTNPSETLPVLEIGASAFARNTVLSKVILPATVSTIGANAFESCTVLTAVEFYGGESQLTMVDYGAFRNCSALNSFTLPAMLKTIGNIAFSGCEQLHDLVIPESVIEIGINAFYNTGYYKDTDNWTNGALYAGRHLIKVDNARFTQSVTEYAILSGTLTVSEFAFENCTGMIKISIPVSVKGIEADAFRGCVNLEEVEYAGSVNDWFAITFVNTLSSPMYYATRMSINGEQSSDLVLPEQITAIPAGTFKGNTNITRVTIPATVTSIGDEAFMGCTNLAEIVFTDDRVTYIGVDAFTDTGLYNNPNNWNAGILILDNRHILATNDSFKESVYIVGDNIRTISQGAFSKREITNLTVGSGVVWIGANAFEYDSLESVTFVNTVGSWFAKNIGGIVRMVTVTADPVANASLLKNYRGEWRKI
ncbi:MAG: leucine-rich repeat domain-containing protein [Clostridiales bacterium]|nr:leucine-rich repeat domain-containing protein [Clostridiales bacterium]